MSKYIDFADEIHQAAKLPFSCSVVETLRWLDEHPEQVPGLATAITRSQWDAATKIADQFVVRDIANAWGLCIIPDPEPTNAEKLMQLLNAHDPHRNRPTADLAGALDAAGVKAPDHD